MKGVTAPVQSRVVITHRKPVQRQVKDGIVVKNTELLATITSSATANAFATSMTSMAISTGTTILPWLSNTARNYDKFEWRSAKLKFTSAIGTQNNGTVGMYFEGDTGDAAAGNMADVMQNNKAKVLPAWTPVMTIDIDRSELMNQQRGLVNVTNVGNCVVATEGLPVSTKVGYVFLEYVIHLSKPTISAQNTRGLLTAPSSEQTEPKFFSDGSADLAPYIHLFKKLLPHAYGTLDWTSFKKCFNEDGSLRASIRDFSPLSVPELLQVMRGSAVSSTRLDLNQHLETLWDDENDC